MLTEHELVKIELEVDQIMSMLDYDDSDSDESDSFTLLRRLDDLEALVTTSYKECVKQRLRVVN